MEKRGIRTDKGEVNRQIAADNKLLKEIKARITRLYNWSKAEAEKPEGQQPSMVDLWEAQQQLKRPDTRTGKIRPQDLLRKPQFKTVFLSVYSQ